ncbi:putative Ig domain-containing protein [Actinoallomurus iriomotensis]|uniref:putative Ig domain-containing protein n=1 Tax=Actinoallomurus iriomotensis TaxID=478107 RepID=UPI002552E10F|nr:putative Ig domain-containing protein [Actinoallomurus iriomotensis]
MTNTGSRAGAEVAQPYVPHGMSSRVGARVSLPVDTVSAAAAKLTFTATGLPAGLSITRSGTITGRARHAGTRTVTVTVKDSSGASGTATFVWTTTGKRRP